MRIKLLTLIFAGLFLSTAIYGQEQKSNILIEKGLAYLASVQSTTKDLTLIGTTSIDPNGIEPLDSKTPGNWGGSGITALCLQAFLQNGHNIDDPVYGTVVTNAINYILSTQDLSGGYHHGAFYGWGGDSRGYETAMSIFALHLALKTPLSGGGYISGAFKTTIENAIALAVNYYTQDVNVAWTRVSWRYNRGNTSETGGDMSVNQWVYLALDAVDYEDKDIWNKIYGYLNWQKCTSGNASRVGYQGCNTRPQGMTCAGAWGAVLAADHGVAAASTLKDQFYNYLGGFTLAQLVNPGSIGSNQIYSGGGYYYYLYGFAKAMALGNKTIFGGGNWYDYMYSAIEGQRIIDGNGNFYWNGWGGDGGPKMETALALLCLQTGTVPPGSQFTISLDSDLTKDDCLEFIITDELGNEAGINSTSFYNNIAGAEWTETGADFWEWYKLLETAGNFNTQIKNLCPTAKEVELCFRVYNLEDVLVDEECFLITIDPYRTIAATSFVNAIGGLNVIIVNPPAEIPIMELDPDVIGYNPFEYSQTYNFTFNVIETGGESPLLNVDLFASPLTDEFGNVIPANSFTITPNFIAAIPPGGSVPVQGTLVTPASFGKNGVGLFQGVITAQTTQQAKAINFEIGKPTMSANPDIINAGYLAGSSAFDLDFSGFIGVDWTIEVVDPWLTVNPLGGNNDAVITVNFDENNSGFERTAFITITAPDALNPEVVVTVIQSEAPFPFFIDAELIVSTDKANWEPADGNLADGFIVGLDALIEYYYLDLGENTQTNVPLMNDYFPFYLDPENVPAGFFNFWANKGVFEGCTGVWEPIMWQIINGELPTFYIRYDTGPKVYPFMLVDGLQKLLGQPDDYLRVNGVYPFGTYHYTGFIQDIAGNMSGEVLVKITFTSEVFQQIELPAGWLGISSYIVPENPDVEIMLDGIEEYMEIILRFGGFYWPPQNINMFGDWNAYEGYKIKMNQGALLEVFGGPAEPAVSFPAGLHYLPVLSPAPVDAEDVLGAVGDALLFAFNIQEGLIYWPQGGLATLETLEPGIGYLIRLLEPATFEFVGKQAGIPQEVTSTMNVTPWNNAVNTGNPHIISITSAALAELEAGDVIGVFNQTGTCVGMANFDGSEGNLALVAYGDDFTTAVIDGMSEGAAFDLRLYRPGTDQQADLTATFDPSFNTGTFETGGLSIINTLKVGSLATGNIQPDDFSIYPNPSTGLFNIVTTLIADVKVLDVKGQTIMERQINGNTQLDLSTLSKGIYYLKISNNEALRIEKIMIK
ncbi:MAG: T9SS type A sorting domain-containing protein [Bacteroidales bacterium]|nr:T9SS type A sorting domain-containing protein [Bacteroidales bacterium]